MNLKNDGKEPPIVKDRTELMKLIDGVKTEVRDKLKTIEHMCTLCLKDIEKLPLSSKELDIIKNRIEFMLSIVR